MNWFLQGMGFTTLHSAVMRRPPANILLAPEGRDAMTQSGARRLRWFERFCIQQCVGASRLPCGCLIGHYLMYGGKPIHVVDDATSCATMLHSVDVVLELGSKEPFGAGFRAPHRNGRDEHPNSCI